MSALRIGVIGAGQIAHYSTKEINEHPDAKVVAISDPSLERAEEVAKKSDIPRVTTNNDELFDDPNIDALSIAVPNALHAPLAKRALKAGKHVILDKPFALSLAEAESVVATARESGKVFTLGMNQRFRGDSQRIRSLVKDGVLGDVYHAKAYWFRRAGIPRMGTWFGNKALSGGGTLLDIGVHLLDLALYVIDDFSPVSVFGATYNKFGHRGLGEGGWGLSDRTEKTFDVEDFATALIRFKNGSTVTLDVSWAAHQKEPNHQDVLIYGTEGGASLYPAQLFQSALEPGGDYRVTEPTDVPLLLSHENRFHNFINAVLGREALVVTAEQALVVQRILDGIYASAATGKEVSLTGRP
jgi:predicted dehydrogenase